MIILGKNEEDCAIFIPTIQQQLNAVDCGLYAIANAVQFAFTREISNTTFKREYLRNHWLRCIEDRKVSLFPTQEDVVKECHIKTVLLKDTRSVFFR